MKKLLIPLLALLLCALPALAEEDEPELLTEGAYEYYLNGNGAVLTGYDAPTPLPQELTLPTEIGGQPVVRYEYVYASLDGTRQEQLRIIVPEGVKDFGDAFVECSLATEIVLPASLAHIAEASLSWMKAEITLHPDNPHFICTDGFLIDSRTSTLLYAAPSAAEKPLPQVTRLGDSCLDNWHAGGSLVLPETLTSIGAYVFSDCIDITGVHIPAGVTSIGEGAFNCCSLTAIELPDGLTAIEHLTFSCTGLTAITIPDGVTRIGEWAFYLVPLTCVKIPASVALVEYQAFDPGVELVLLGENTHLETEEEYELRMWGPEEESEPETFLEGAYEYYLTDEGAVITWYEYAAPLPEVIEIPAALGGNPVVAIENGFSTCYDEFWDDDIQRIIVPEGVKSIGDAFLCCPSVKELVLPSTLEDIPEGALYHVYAEITLHPDNPHFTCADGFLIDLRTSTLLYTAPSAWEKPLPEVRRLGMDCLYNWNSWEKDVVLPATVEEIGPRAFYDTNLNSITLNEGLKRIDSRAFSCIILTTPVEIPASVEMVEWAAFPEPFEEASVFVCRSPETKVETYFEYAERTGDDSWMEDYTAELFSYELTDGGAVITEWDHAGYGAAVPEVITLPAVLGKSPVIGVANNALNTSEMPDEHSFTLVIPEGVQWLAAGALTCCHNAETLVLPASLMRIPESISDHVYADVILAEDNPRYAMQDGFLIDTQEDVLVYAAPSAAGAPLPAVRRIGSGSLDNWLPHAPWGELALIIPEGVEEIGSFAFYDWEIKSIALPESLRLIESGAFESCLAEGATVAIPAGVETVQYGAFGLYSGPAVELMLLGTDTHVETAAEYAVRTGEDWVLSNE